jgi:hypothetical protein
VPNTFALDLYIQPNRPERRRLQIALRTVAISVKPISNRKSHTTAQRQRINIESQATDDFFTTVELPTKSMSNRRLNPTTNKFNE